MVKTKTRPGDRGNARILSYIPTYKSHSETKVGAFTFSEEQRCFKEQQRCSVEAFFLMN